MLLFSRSLSALAAVGLLAPGLALLGGCGREFGPPGPEHSETQNIELDNSDEVRAEVNMGAGELRIRGGASKLLEARFRYSGLRMRPEVSYRAAGGSGHLVVEEPHGLHSAPRRNRWDLAFNSNKPLDLELNCGAGQSHLDLGDLSLRRVSVDMGVGELRMDLRGTPKSNYSVSINGGVGQATVYLPGGSDVGVEAEAEGGIGGISTSGLQKRDGRYVNDAFGHAKTTVRVDIHGGIGQIRLIAD